MDEAISQIQSSCLTTLDEVKHTDKKTTTGFPSIVRKLDSLIYFDYALFLLSNSWNNVPSWPPRWPRYHLFRHELLRNFQQAIPKYFILVRHQFHEQLLNIQRKYYSSPKKAEMAVRLLCNLSMSFWKKMVDANNEEGITKIQIKHS